MRIADTKCTLKDGRKMRIFSNNPNERTMHLYPEEKAVDFDPEFDTVTRFSYDEIETVETWSKGKVSVEGYNKSYNEQLL